MNLNNLGLINKARGLICGEDKVVEKLRDEQVYYIFLAKDSGKNTLKKINDKASFYNVEVNLDYTSDELSQVLGKINVHVVGITNKGFLKIIEK